MFQTSITYIHIDSLESGEQTSVTVPLNNDSSYDTSEILLSLINQGLTEKEAQDLIDYWKRIWFYPTNFGSYAQMIYTIPQEIYDELLPINIIPMPEIMNRVGLFFITDIPIDDQPVLTKFLIDEDCTADPWNESELGIKEVRWKDTILGRTALFVKANVSINCAFDIGNGNVKLENDTLRLEYEVIRYGDTMANCICAKEITYLVLNLDREYELELVPIYIQL
jgi:hypothetical protein